MSRPKGSKNRVVVLNETNVESVNNIALPYKATLKIVGKSYEAQGETLKESILNLKPVFAKGRSILTIEKDGKKVEKILQPMITYRLFNAHGLTREVACKNVSILFSL